MPKKDSEKSEAEEDAGVEVPVPEQEHSGATSEPKDASHGDGPIADFDKYTKDVKRSVAEQPQADRPHGHPMDSTAEPVLVTEGSGSGQMTREQRKNQEYALISPEEAYEDPEFNPVAAAEPPGHRGGPGAPDAEGSDRQTPGPEVKEVIDSGHDEKPENLEYDWKGGDAPEK